MKSFDVSKRRVTLPSNNSWKTQTRKPPAAHLLVLTFSGRQVVSGFGEFAAPGITRVSGSKVETLVFYIVL